MIPNRAVYSFLRCRVDLSAITIPGTFTSSPSVVFTGSPTLTLLRRRNLFENALERERRSYRFVVAGYVVMPEHVHLLISEPRRSTVAGVIHALKLSVTLRRRERPFWQARYYDFNVHTTEKRIEKLRYMHRNPVKRGLVARPEEWLWSSFRHYATGQQRVVEIESEWTAARRGMRLPAEYELRRLAH